MVPVEITVPAENQTFEAVNLPVTFIGPVTEVPVRLVTVSKFEPDVTLSGLVADDEPTVSAVFTVRLLAEPPPFRLAAPETARGPVLATPAVELSTRL